MKTNYALLQFAFIFASLFVFTQKLEAQTPGQLTFEFKTVTQNGTYAPKHVLAAWIEQDGVFVKTRLVQANNRKQYLYTWKAQSNSNEVDAITGSTLTSHQTRSITWDCKDLDGNTVPDGEYVVWVEFTEKHAQGPFVGVAFTKGVDAVQLTPANQDNYIDMVLDYSPDGVGITNQKQRENWSVYPNPSSGLFYIDNKANEDLNVVIYTLNGTEIGRQEVSPKTNNRLDLTHYSKGIYLLRIAGKDATQMVRVSLN